MFVTRNRFEQARAALERAEADLRAEREARVRAEATAARTEEEVGAVRAAHSELMAVLKAAGERHGEDLRAQAERHERATADLLDRIAPKPRDPQQAESEGDLPHLTAAQIRAMPANSKREMLLREQYAQAAEARVRAAAGKKEVEERRAEMTEEELQTLDESIVGRIE